MATAEAAAGFIWLSKLILSEDNMASSILSTQSKGAASLDQSGPVSVSQQTFSGSKTFTNGLKTNQIQADTTTSINAKNSSGTTTATISETGNLSVLNNIQQNGSNIISWVEITPTSTEWSFTGPANGSVTINPATIPANARFVLLDVFLTANQTDHFNLSLGRSTITSLVNWVAPRGTQPSTYFNTGVGTRNVVSMTHHGDSDTYTALFGKWWSSVITPCSGRTLYYDCAGVNSSATTGWVYIIVKAYSL
jgi:hypothetical protein